MKRWIQKGLAGIMLVAGLVISGLAVSYIFDEDIITARADEVLTEEVGEGVYSYTIDDNGNVTITGWTGTDTELIIPSELGGGKVTSIGWYAFSECTSLTDIEIPKGVTSIESGTFAYCENLERITIPSSVTDFYEEEGEDPVFFDCDKLTIYSPENSAAHKYAVAHNIPFVAISEESTEPSEPETLPVEPDETVKDVIEDVTVSEDVAFEDDIKVEDVKVSIKPASDSVVKAIADALKEKLLSINIKLEDADANYYDISLIANDKVVKLQSGKVEITFAWEEGKSLDKHDVKVYHYDSATDKLEEVAAVLSKDGIKIEADSFSPYIIVYSDKTVEEPSTEQPDDEKVPQKGDATSVVVYSLFAGALLVLAGVGAYGRRKKNNI